MYNFPPDVAAILRLLLYEHLGASISTKTTTVSGCKAACGGSYVLLHLSRLLVELPPPQVLRTSRLTPALGTAEVKETKKDCWWNVAEGTMSWPISWQIWFALCFAALWPVARHPQNRLVFQNRMCRVKRNLLAPPHQSYTRAIPPHAKETCVTLPAFP